MDMIVGLVLLVTKATQTIILPCNIALRCWISSMKGLYV